MGKSIFEEKNSHEPLVHEQVFGMALWERSNALI